MDALDDLLVKRYQQLVSDEPKPLNAGFESTDPFVAVVRETAQEPQESAQESEKEPSSLDGSSDSPCDLQPEAMNGEDEHNSGETPEEDVAEESTMEANSDDPTLENLKPAWEVDRFLWPAICGDVEEKLEADLISTVESIRSESAQRNKPLVALVNSEEGSGATTVTMCLAREAARQGQRVAVVDLNHVRPGLMGNLGIDCEQGIESLQLANVGVEDICVSAIEDGVTLVPLLKPIDVEYGTGQGVRDLLHRLAQTHDLVLLDTTAQIVQRLANESPQVGLGVIVVSKTDKSDKSEINSSGLKSLESNPGASWNLGTVKNFAA